MEAEEGRERVMSRVLAVLAVLALAGCQAGQAAQVLRLADEVAHITGKAGELEVADAMLHGAIEDLEKMPPKKDLDGETWAKIIGGMATIGAGTWVGINRSRDKKYIDKAKAESV